MRMIPYAAVIAATLFCISPAKADDEQAHLPDLLAFAEEYEVELSIWKRCVRAFTEVYYGKARATPFLDEVAIWTRAMRDGNGGLADAHYALIVGDIKGALDVRSEMQRRQITDRYRFSRELAKDCRASGIRELARQ